MSVQNEILRVVYARKDTERVHIVQGNRILKTCFMEKVWRNKPHCLPMTSLNQEKGNGDKVLSHGDIDCTQLALNVRKIWREHALRRVVTFCGGGERVREIETETDS